VRAALRKLVRALPETFRSAAEAAATAVVIDPRAWGSTAAPRRIPVHLDALQRAVVEGECVELGYMARSREATTRVVHPLGLAAKGGAWYLIASTVNGLRTFRIDRVESVVPTGDPVVRPDGFVLADAWKLILDDLDRVRLPVDAKGLVEAEHVQLCRHILGDRVRIGGPVPDGRIAVEFRGHHVRALAGELAGLGDHVEILEPPELREILGAIGAELIGLYRA
jgi:predicted DNA-binding transcriptional regulator YafY